MQATAYALRIALRLNRLGCNLIAPIV